MAKEKPIEVDGKIQETLPNATFRVVLDNDHVILAHVSGKMRMHYIKLMPGDKVKIEMSPYDLSKGNLQISTPVPSNDRYWSIHAHNRNTDAFYKITNTEIDKDDFQFIISKDKTFKHNLPIAYASSNNGVILIRLTMKYFNEYDALDNFRRSTTKQYLKTL